MTTLFDWSEGQSRWRSKPFWKPGSRVDLQGALGLRPKLKKSWYQVLLWKYLDLSNPRLRVRNDQMSWDAPTTTCWMHRSKTTVPRYWFFVTHVRVHVEEFLENSLTRSMSSISVVALFLSCSTIQLVHKPPTDPAHAPAPHEGDQKGEGGHEQWTEFQLGFGVMLLGLVNFFVGRQILSTNAQSSHTDYRQTCRRPL